MKKLLFVLSAAVLCFLSAAVMPACKEDDEPMVVEPTLYDTLGGTALVADPANPGMMIEKGRLGIRSVVDSTIFVIAGDSRINGFF